jgi:hypothetical protein
MLILFSKLPGERHDIVVRGRAHGPDLRRLPRETGRTIPHDLAHAAVEEALGLQDGFWAAVDQGVMFEDFRLLEPERHRRAGLKALRRFADRTFPAELKVSWAHRVWSGQRTSGRGLEPEPALLSDEQIRVACVALDRAKERWDALGQGESLAWDWRLMGRF